MTAYDVIIVGAGPGGLSCARTLSGSGLKVLVLEKNDSLGKKICSGEISPKVLPDEDFDRGHPWTELTIGTDETSQTISFDRPFLWTIGRREFESHLMSGCDAEIRFSEPVISIGEGYVQTPKGRYGYRHLVGADGSFSTVREHLGLPTERIAGWAYHYVIEEIPSEFHLYWLPKSFPRSYGYVMSKNRDKTMVGIATAGKDFDHLFASRARDWIRRRFGLDVRSLQSEAMKGNSDYRGWRHRNIFLVGDAAGFLNPLTTEGIYYAVKSGEGVARHILGDEEGERIMERLARKMKWKVRIFDLATDTSLPFCWMIDWILKDPRHGLRRRIFESVLWRFMNG